MIDKEYLDYRFYEIKTFINDSIKDIEKMESFTFKSLCMFSLLDTFVQNHFRGRKMKQINKFDNFLNEFLDIQNQYSWLNLTDPITLFYEDKKLFLQHNIHIDAIDCLAELNPYTINNLEMTKQIINLAKSAIPKKINQHKFTNLLYKWRSKLSHEANEISITFKSMQQELLPQYYVIGNKDNCVKLVFPYIVIKNIVIDAINNYLKKYKEEGIDPFNNSVYYLNWYEE